MKLRYKVDDIGNNVYQAYPQVLEACCNQSILWFMRGGAKSWNVVNSFIIQQVDEKTTESFYFCQYCGKKHEAIEISADPKEPVKKKNLL